MIAYALWEHSKGQISPLEYMKMTDVEKAFHIAFLEDKAKAIKEAERG